MPLPERIGQLEANIEQNNKGFAEYERTTNANEQYTEEAKSQLINEAHERYEAHHRAVVNEIVELREEHKQQLKRQVFGPPLNPAMVDTQADRARRDFSGAQDRAEQAVANGGLSALEKLYERDAVVGGDETAARAIFTVAREHGFEDLAARYLSSNPLQQERLEELSQLEEEDADPFWFGFRYHGPVRPSPDPGFARLGQVMGRR